MVPARIVSACSVFCLAAVLVVGCGQRPVDSIWRDREITIDGRDTEWHGARVILEDASVGFGIINDADYLYLTLSVSDPAIQAQILRQGFTVWLDAHGGKSESFGVRFPLGLMAMKGSGDQGDVSGLTDQETGFGDLPPFMDQGLGRGGKMTRAQLESLYERATAQQEAQIIGPRRDQVRRVLVAESGGILLATRYERGRLVYELRAPLASASQRPVGLGAAPGARIGVGFETPEMDLRALRAQMSEQDRPGGVMGDGSMGRGNRGDNPMRGGRGARGRRMQGREPFQVWTRVQLARSDS
jgi:hypothetical protein